MIVSRKLITSALEVYQYGSGDVTTVKSDILSSTHTSLRRIRIYTIDNMNEKHLVLPALIAIQLWMLRIGRANLLTEVPELFGPCHKLQDETITAFVGFPVTIELYDFHKHKLCSYPSPKCVVRELSSNATVNIVDVPEISRLSHVYRKKVPVYRIAELLSNTSRGFKIECGIPINSSAAEQAVPELIDGSSCPVPNEDAKCITFDVHVTARDISVDDCTGSVADKLVNVSFTSDMHVLTCEAPRYWTDGENISLKWFRQVGDQCLTTFRDFVRVGEYHLFFNDAGFEDIGTYVCMAYFEDRKIILKKAHVCVTDKWKPALDAAELQCGAARVPIHGDGEIKCDVALSVAKSDPGDFSWSKVIDGGRELIPVCNESQVSPWGDNRITCSEIGSIEEDHCYRAAPTNRSHAPTDIHTITLKIRHMTEEDFGEYRLEYQPASYVGNALIANVTVQRDVRQASRNRIAGISAGVLLLILIVTLVVLCVAMKMDILWFYKRHFGPCETELLPYTAYFVYHYDATKSKDESMRKLRALISCMNSYMENYGGTIYDEQKDVPLNQYDAENVMAVQKECSRVVLFLSASFVTDHWSRYALYSTLESVIREGKKIIVISTPQTRAAMKRIDKEPRRVLEMAMKRNATIHWNGKTPLCRRFLRRLEYALPKYGKPDLNRFLSNSSQAYLTQHGGSPVNTFQKAEYKSGVETIGIA